MPVQSHEVYPMHMPQLEREWTVDGVLALPNDGNRYELIDGELLVSPAPTLRHQDAVARLYRLLAEYLEREPVGRAFISAADIIFSPRRLVQPDVFVAPMANGRPSEWSDITGLLVAAEVLSPSTARADRVTKRRLFRDQGVPESWIVDLDARTIERSTPADARPEVLAERLEWLPEGASKPLVIELGEYFAAVLDG